MTAEECIAMGGHCMKPTGMTRLCDPPIYVYRCKHCRIEADAEAQPPMRWIDAEMRKQEPPR